MKLAAKIASGLVVVSLALPALAASQSPAADPQKPAAEAQVKRVPAKSHSRTSRLTAQAEAKKTEPKKAKGTAHSHPKGDAKPAAGEKAPAAPAPAAK